MDTRFIDSFVVVAEFGSIAEASRRLNITASALAQRIRVLEQHFGVKLLLRSGRYVNLTEAGLRLLAQAKDFQREVRKLTDATAAGHFPGRLRFGTIRTALAGIAPRMLQIAFSLQPDLRTFIEIGLSQELYHQVTSGKLDMALMIAPPFRIPKSLRWYSLRLEPLVVLCPLRCLGMDAIQVLRTEPFIRYDRLGWGGAVADLFLQENDIRPTERVELDVLDGILLMVEMGLGVSLIPDCMDISQMSPKTITLPLNGDVPSREIGLLMPAQSPYASLIDDILGAAGAGQGLTQTAGQPVQARLT